MTAVERAVKDSIGRGAGFALGAYGLFATHDTVVKYLGGSYSVFQIMFFAVLFGLVPVTIMIAADPKADNLRPHHPWLVAARTITNLVSSISAFYAFTALPLTEVYALIFATPILITALSVPLLGETVRARRWAAVIVGLIGVLVVLRPGYTALGPGHIAALVCASGGALSAIIVRKIGSEERTAVLVLYPMLAKLLGAALFLPFIYVPMPIIDLGLVAAMGLLAMVGQICMIYAYRAAPSAIVAPFQYSQILWALPFGIFLFAEKPDPMVWLGALIIIASGMFIVWRESRGDTSLVSPVIRNPNTRPDVIPSPRPRSTSMKPVDPAE